MSDSDFSPADILGAVLDAGTPLAQDIAGLTGTIFANRDAIRGLYTDDGAITTIPDGLSPYARVGASDGAHTINRMVIGDHITTLALAITQDSGDQPRLSLAPPRSWSAVRPHCGDQGLLAAAVMMMDEQVLLAAFPPNTLGIIDGSHTSAVTAVASALASFDPSVRDAIIARCADTDMIGIVAAAATNTDIVACPKSDSSTGLWDYAAQRLALTGPALPDKVVASIILNSAEALTSPEATVTWDRFTSTVARTTGQSAAYAGRLADAVQPLIDTPLRVTHVKPEGADIAIRVEMKGHTSPFTAADIVQAVARDCYPPFVQEPLTQYLADLAVKTIAPAGDALMAIARLDTPEHHDALLRRYRT